MRTDGTQRGQATMANSVPVVISSDQSQFPVKLQDRDKNESFITRYGQLTVGQRHDDILCRFEYNNSTYDVSITNTGTGTSSNTDSVSTISSGAGVGTSTLKSIRSVTYRPGHEIYYFSTLMWGGTIDADTSAYGGLFDTVNGFAYGYNGTSFGILKRSDNNGSMSMTYTSGIIPMRYYVNSMIISSSKRCCNSI